MRALPSAAVTKATVRPANVDSRRKKAAARETRASASAAQLLSIQEAVAAAARSIMGTEVHFLLQQFFLYLRLVCSVETRDTD